MAKIVVIKRKKRLLNPTTGNMFLCREERQKIPVPEQLNHNSKKLPHALNADLQSEIERVFAKWPKAVQTA
jgi:hypothetical protein